uniref:Uncharacterized protein n=1 Tax=Plectus sambesii TaxID=2011161 RepID=A0A914WDU7_9BILA
MRPAPPIALWSLLIAAAAVVVQAAQNEYNLYKQLLKEYDSLERPVFNSSEAITVRLGMALQQLINVDEKNQIIEVNAWLKYTWIDYKMIWDPKDHGDVTDLRFKVHQLWKPDVLLYNSVDSNFDSTYPTNMLVYSNGLVSWIPPGIFKISCHIDIKWFPFDEQTCYFKFGSWTYDGSKIDLQEDENGFDLSNYMVNGEWSLINTTIVRNIQYYDCCPEPYFDLMFNMRLRRRTLYYGFNLIIPCILITLMTLMGFTLPPDAGEKISLRAFFSCCMFTVSASVVFTVLVLNLHHRSPQTHDMSHFTRALLLHWLPWLLLLHRPGYILSRKNLPNPFWSTKKSESESLLRNIRVIETEQLAGRNSFELDPRISACLNSISTSEKSPLTPGQTAQLLMMERIYFELKFITKRMIEEDEDKFQESEWKFAAMVVDRLCLVIFTLFIVASTCGIFFSAPYLIE